MQMKQCERGHFFDPMKHSSCPFCGVPNLDIPNQTKAKRSDDFSASSAPPMAGVTVPRHQVNVAKPSPNEGRTVGMIQKKQGIDPVVGWLVCIEGPEKGRDFRIRSENNFIGRAEGNDIQIKGDDSVSKEKHAVVTYDPENNIFVLQPGGGRGLVYLNGQPMYSFSQLNAYDKVKMGQTTLLFVSFCGEQFKW